MSTIILLNQSSASLRCVPLPPLVQSNGTSACTNESGRTFYFSIGGVDYGSGGSISVISSTLGLYECLFAASKVSVAGQGRVYYSSNTALPASTPIEIVKYDSYDSQRFGMFSIPNANPEAAGGFITFGTGSGQLHVSTGSVGLKAQVHSQATVTPAAGDYSSIVTVGVGNIKGASYSDVTIQGVTRVNSSTTPANATYSSLTVRIEGVSYSGLTIDGVRMLATPAERSIASSLLSTNMGNSRILQEYLWPLRNRVQISGSTMTVFLTDDTTSSWTATVSTGTATIYGIDPGGP